MILVFYFFAVILVWLSFKSFVGGIRYLRYFRKELEKPQSNLTPFVSIIAPCKGIDKGFEGNITVLFQQDYPDYEVIFVVDDPNDDAVASIERIRASRGILTRIVVAPRATSCGQKVENLRAGVLQTSDRCEVIVFVDSDARPSKDWLRALVAPLEDNCVGAATGYRWFVSETPNFATEMTSAWNASIASALGPNRKSNFCWGGSTAIRKETFDALAIRNAWYGSVSDDFVLAQVVREAGLDIVFVPRALTASLIGSTFRGMLEFTNRQMKLTRVYAPKLWLMTLFGTAVFNGVLIAAIYVALTNELNTLAFWGSIAILALVAVFSIGKAWLRLKAVKLALPEYDAFIKRQFLPQNTLWVVTGALFFINSLAALFSRRITWRGIKYRLNSPTETVIIPE